MSGAESKKLDSLHVSTLYVRYFDLDWDEIGIQPYFRAPVHFIMKPLIAVQPVVYITNRTFKRLPIAECNSLARKVLDAVEQINASAGINQPSVIQTDCDWTDDTRQKYFAFLREFRTLLHARSIKLTVTIRLHQVKYQNITGIPPADRRILMFYNMGNLKNPETKNTIYDEQAAKSYLINFDRYPLNLDIALPLFGWIVVRRHQRSVLLLDNPDWALIYNNPKIRKTDENNYTVTENTIYNYHYLYEGDQLHYEGVNPETCLQAAKLIKPYLKGDSINVSIFSWNEKNISATSTGELETVYNVFP